MGDLLLACLLSGIFVLFGMAFFPSLNGMIRNIDVSGMTNMPILAAGIRAMPYIIMVIVVWAALKMIKHRVNH